jgi:hypothetical protein
MKSTIIIFIGIIIISILTFYVGYTKGVSAGVEDTTALFDTTIKDYKAHIETQAVVVNSLIETRSVNLSSEISTLLKDTTEIRAALKKQPQPLVVIKDSECIADQVLLDARREIIERINK